MAPHVTTVISVARLGSRAVRYLIQPAKTASTAQHLSEWGRDPWLPSPQQQGRQKLERGANLARRGLGLLTLFGLAVLGTFLLGLAVLISGIGVAAGHTFAAWIMGLILLLGLFGAYWTARRASSLIKGQAEVPVPTTPTPQASGLEADEAGLLNLLYRYEKVLPSSARSPFRDTVIATRDALRLTADDAALSRETFDARQAAREDLPELLDAYRSVPISRESDAQFLEQLQLIEARMQHVAAQRTADRQRELQSNGKYLQSKYQEPDAEE